MKTLFSFTLLFSFCLLPLHAEDAIALKMKWEPDQVQERSIKIDTEMEITGEQLPQPMQQKINQTMRLGMTTGKRDADGNLGVVLEYKSMKMNMEVAGQNMRFDSEKPADEDPAHLGILRNIIGAQIKMTVDKAGELQAMKGMDKMMKKIAGGNQQLAQMFSEDNFKQIMNASLAAFLPKKPVKSGDEWQAQVDMKVPMIGMLIMDAKYKFVGMEERHGYSCARLNFTGSMKTKGGGEQVDAGPVKMSISIKNGAFEGTSWFDPELGMEIENNTRQKMKMETIVGDPANGAKMMTDMDMSMIMKLDKLGKRQKGGQKKVEKEE